MINYLQKKFLTEIGYKIPGNNTNYECVYLKNYYLEYKCYLFAFSVYFIYLSIFKDFKFSSAK